MSSLVLKHELPVYLDDDFALRVISNLFCLFLLVIKVTTKWFSFFRLV